MATELCANCGEKITHGGIIGSANYRLSKLGIDTVNFVYGTEYQELCDLCGTEAFNDCKHILDKDAKSCEDLLANAIVRFPLLTVGMLPAGSDYKIIGMITANVTVGTGLFNEFSQGFSDMFGLVNSQSGMAHKVNSGETAARGILVSKALEIGANCVIGVDVDYGVTTNNAATINMQGTAIIATNPELALSSDSVQASQDCIVAKDRMRKISKWRRGKFAEDEKYQSFAEN